MISQETKDKRVTVATAELAKATKRAETASKRLADFVASLDERKADLIERDRKAQAALAGAAAQLTYVQAAPVAGQVSIEDVGTPEGDDDEDDEDGPYDEDDEDDDRMPTAVAPVRGPGGHFLPRPPASV